MGRERKGLGLNSYVALRKPLIGEAKWEKNAWDIIFSNGLGTTESRP